MHITILGIKYCFSTNSLSIDKIYYSGIFLGQFYKIKNNEIHYIAVDERVSRAFIIYARQSVGLWTLGCEYMILFPSFRRDCDI